MDQFEFLVEGFKVAFSLVFDIFKVLFTFENIRDVTPLLLICGIAILIGFTLGKAQKLLFAFLSTGAGKITLLFVVATVIVSAYVV
ncbi:hypothetical protein MHH37_15780 [Solibacillus sp. FSL K6-1781]|uniref:hypothetical protein n=1 Tax=Solibacillus sp. FSL K6-1781 TaxID=2921474 RepID=UPI0031599C63